MNPWINLDQLNHYLSNGSLGFKILMSIIIIAAYVMFKKMVNRAIINFAAAKGVSKARLSFIQRATNVGLLFVFSSFFAITIGIGYGDVSLFLSSVFAVLGVAFIAQWSILSNITASFLIFFVFPYRVGDRIKVVEKDEDISGEIQNISMFHVLIKHDNGNLITYPNNLILQKAVLKLPKTVTGENKYKSRLYTRRGRKYRHGKGRLTSRRSMSGLTPTPSFPGLQCKTFVCSR